MRTQGALPVTLLSTILLFSCQSEPDDISAPKTSCKVVKVYSHDLSGSLIDSALYTYTDDRVTKIEVGNGDYYTLEYNGDKILRRNVFSLAYPATPYAYELFSYNSDGTISKVDGYSNFGSLKYVDKTTLDYTAGKVTKLSFFRIDPDNKPIIEKEDSFTYTGDNVTKRVTRAYYSGVLLRTDSLALEYDNLPNYYRMQNPQLLVVDPLFFVDADAVIFGSSKNNAIKWYALPSTIPFANVTYSPDDKGNISTMASNGVTILRYLYKCP